MKNEDQLLAEVLTERLTEQFNLNTRLILTVKSRDQLIASQADQLRQQKEAMKAYEEEIARLKGRLAAGS